MNLQSSAHLGHLIYILTNHLYAKGDFQTIFTMQVVCTRKVGLSSNQRGKPAFFVYRIKSKFSVKRRNPNPSPTWKIEFKFTSFVILAHFGVSSTQIQVVISREKCTKNGTQKIKLVQNRKN